MGILIPIALKTSSALSVAYENECLGLLVSMFRQRYKNANLYVFSLKSDDLLLIQ